MKIIGVCFLSFRLSLTCKSTILTHCLHWKTRILFISNLDISTMIPAVTKCCAGSANCPISPFFHREPICPPPQIASRPELFNPLRNTLLLVPLLETDCHQWSIQMRNGPYAEKATRRDLTESLTGERGKEGVLWWP